MTEDTKLYTYAKVPKMTLKQVSLGAHEAMGALTIAIEGEGISIDCPVDISREDAMSINQALHTWYQAFEAMRDGVPDDMQQVELSGGDHGQ